MEQLFEKSYQKIDRAPVAFSRYLFSTIKWKSRLICIKGARGAGKTTLLLQYAKSALPIDHRTLYVSLDALYFAENTLVGLADQFVKQGGQYLLLDEVHQYPNWSREIKNLYDDYPDLKVIFTGSSIMHLNQATGDLSRRAVMYELFGLSFREFLNFTQGTDFKSISLVELIEKHTEIARSIIQEVQPLAHFQSYLEYGFYPYFIEDSELYPQRLAETIALALNVDLPASHEITFASIEKIRMLLYIIAESVPFKPNISKLSARIGVSRNSLVQYLKYLEDLRIIKGLYPEVKGIGLLQKPSKIFLFHPNIQYALAGDKTDIGNLRESFFLNQIGTESQTGYLEAGDFSFKGYTFEVGGKGKTNKQIAHLEKAYIAADQIEIGHGHKIPLWLFGFLY